MAVAGLDQGPFPWKEIGTLVVKVAATGSVVVVGMVALGRRQERIDYADKIRVRWTDANRWER